MWELWRPCPYRVIVSINADTQLKHTLPNNAPNTNECLAADSARSEEERRKKKEGRGSGREGGS